MFKEYIQELKEKSFMEEIEEKKKKFIVLTHKGETFLEEYKQLSTFIKNFGL